MKNFLAKIITSLGFIMILIFPFSLAQAASTDLSCHTLEINLPGLSGPICGPSDYLAGLYKLGLGLGVLAAGVIIVYAGVIYSTSGVTSKQGEAIKQIQAALLGLLLLFTSVIILKAINPDLLNLNKFQLPTVGGGVSGGGH